MSISLNSIRDNELKPLDVPEPTPSRPVNLERELASSAERLRPDAAPPEFSKMEGYAAALSEAWGLEFTNSIYRAAALWTAGLGGDYLTPDEYAEIVGPFKELIPYKPDMTEAQLNLLMDWRAGEASRRRAIENSNLGAFGALAAGFSGSFLDPISVALIAFPSAWASKSLAQMSTRRLMAAGAAYGFADATVREPVILASTAYTGTPYTVQDSVINLIASPLLGGTLPGVMRGVPAAIRKAKNANFWRSLSDDASAANYAKDAASDPNVAREINSRTERESEIVRVAREKEDAAAASESESARPIEKEILTDLSDSARTESQTDYMRTDAQNRVLGELIDPTTGRFVDPARAVRALVTLFKHGFNNDPVLRARYAEDGVSGTFTGGGASRRIAREIEAVSKLSGKERTDGELRVQKMVEDYQQRYGRAPFSRDYVGKVTGVVVRALEAVATREPRWVKTGDGASLLISGKAFRVIEDIFGVNLRFIPGDVADELLGAHGFVRSDEMRTIYLRDDASSNFTAYLTGHELAHTIRMADPQLWGQMVNYIMSVADTLPVVRDAFHHAMKVQGEKFQRLNRVTQFDEVMADVLGRALVERDFWVGLRKSLKPTAFEKIVSAMRRFYRNYLVVRWDEFGSRIASPAPDEYEFWKSFGEIVFEFSPHRASERPRIDPGMSAKAMEDIRDTLYQAHRQRYDNIVTDATIDRVTAYRAIDAFFDREFLMGWETAVDRSTFPKKLKPTAVLDEAPKSPFWYAVKLVRDMKVMPRAELDRIASSYKQYTATHNERFTAQMSELKRLREQIETAKKRNAEIYGDKSPAANATRAENLAEINQARLALSKVSRELDELKADRRAFVQEVMNQLPVAYRKNRSGKHEIHVWQNDRHAYVPGRGLKSDDDYANLHQQSNAMEDSGPVKWVMDDDLGMPIPEGYRSPIYTHMIENLELANNKVWRAALVMELEGYPRSRFTVNKALGLPIPDRAQGSNLEARLWAAKKRGKRGVREFRALINKDLMPAIFRADGPVPEVNKKRRSSAGRMHYPEIPAYLESLLQELGTPSRRGKAKTYAEEEALRRWRRATDTYPSLRRITDDEGNVIGYEPIRSDEPMPLALRAEAEEFYNAKAIAREVDPAVSSPREVAIRLFDDALVLRWERAIERIRYLAELEDSPYWAARVRELEQGLASAMDDATRQRAAGEAHPTVDLRKHIPMGRESSAALAPNPERSLLQFFDSERLIHMADDSNWQARANDPIDAISFMASDGEMAAPRASDPTLGRILQNLQERAARFVDNMTQRNFDADHGTFFGPRARTLRDSIARLIADNDDMKVAEQQFLEKFNFAANKLNPGERELLLDFFYAQLRTEQIVDTITISHYSRPISADAFIRQYFNAEKLRRKLSETDAQFERRKARLTQRGEDTWRDVQQVVAKAERLDESIPDAIRKFLTHQDQAQFNQTVAQQKAMVRSWARIGDPAHESPWQALRSYLTGAYRPGVLMSKIRDSVHGDIQGGRATAYAPLVSYLESVGRLGEFRDRGSKYSPFVRDVADILENNLQAPEGRNIDPTAIETARILTDIYKAQAAQMNTLGADISWRMGYIFSRQHDPARIRKDVGAWKKWMLEHIDWEATEANHGGIMFEADSLKPQPFDRNTFLNAMAETLLDPAFRHPEDISGALAREHSHSSSIRFKKGAELEYDAKFGSGNPAGRFLNQIVKNAEDIERMRKLGPDYEEWWSEMTSRVQKIHDSKAKTNPKIKGDGNFWIKTRTLFDFVTGTMDNPENMSLASKAQAIRLINNVAHMGLSAFSAISDTAQATAQLRWAGIKLGVLDTKYWAAFARQAKNHTPSTVLTPMGDMAPHIYGSGVGFGALTGSIVYRVTADMPGDGVLKRMNDWMFRLNGLTWLTQVQKSAVAEILMTSHANALSTGKMNDSMRRSFSHYGFTPAELAAMQKGVTRAKNALDMDVDIISVDSILPHSPSAARKYRNMIADMASQAASEADVETAVMMRGGLRDGTWGGVAMRVATQYMNVPVAIASRTYRRFIWGYGEQTAASIFSQPGATKFIEIGAYLATAMVMGWAAVNLKEMSKGRTPNIPLLNAKEGDLARIIYQSGVAGPLSDYFISDGLPDFAFGLSGPTISTALKFADPDASHYRRLEILRRQTPFSSLPGVDSTQRHIFSLLLGDALNIHYEMNHRNYLRFTAR